MFYEYTVCYEHIKANISVSLLKMNCKLMHCVQFLRLYAAILSQIWQRNEDHYNALVRASKLYISSRIPVHLSGAVWSKPLKFRIRTLKSCMSRVSAQWLSKVRLRKCCCRFVSTFGPSPRLESSLDVNVLLVSIPESLVCESWELWRSEAHLPSVWLQSWGCGCWWRRHWSTGTGRSKRTVFFLRSVKRRLSLALFSSPSHNSEPSFTIRLRNAK